MATAILPVILPLLAVATIVGCGASTINEPVNPKQYKVSIRNPTDSTKLIRGKKFSCDVIVDVLESQRRLDFLTVEIVEKKDGKTSHALKNAHLIEGGRADVLAYEVTLVAPAKPGEYLIRAQGYINEIRPSQVGGQPVVRAIRMPSDPIGIEVKR